MRKFLSLFTCALLLSLSAFAQTTIEKVFEPVGGQEYLIKVESKDRGRYVTYLAEGLATVDDVPDSPALVQVEMDAAAAIADEATKWYIKYEDGKGYTFQNKKTGHYFKYNGTDEVVHASNIIAPAENVAEKDHTYYFETMKSSAVFSTGNSQYPFDIQGYLIRVPYTTPIQCLDAYSLTGTGSWDFSNNSKDNHIWWFLTPEKALAFEAATKAENFRFVPEGDGVYYIKNNAKRRGHDTHFLTDGGEGLFTFTGLTSEEVKTHDAAKWKIVLDYETGYTIQNVATGNKVIYIGDYEAVDAAGFRGKDFFQLAADGEREAERYNFYIKTQIGTHTIPSYFVGAKDANGNIVSDIKHFGIQPYGFLAINSLNNQVWDAYGTDYQPETYGMGSYDMWNGDNQRWWIMTDQMLADWEAAEAETVFTPEEDALYRIRPNNYSYKVPEGSEVTEEEFEILKNCRLADAGGQVWLYQFDAEDPDPSQDWEFIPSSVDGKFWLRNYDSEDYMVVEKWALATGEDEKSKAMASVYMTGFDMNDINQFVSVDFIGYQLNEFGGYEKVYAIGNTNTTSDVEGKETTQFMLDNWGDAYAGNRIATYAKASTVHQNQRFIIRKVDENNKEVAPTTIGKEVISEETTIVYGSNGKIVVKSEYPVNTTVYTISGITVKQTKESEIAVTPGFYIVKAGTKAFKVRVR